MGGLITYVRFVNRSATNLDRLHFVEQSQNAIPIPGDIPGYLDVVPTKEGYPHIALFAPVTASEPIWITKGEWEVASGISGVDLKNGIA